MNQESELKRWAAQKDMAFETRTVHDVILVKFYAEEAPNAGAEET